MINKENITFNVITSFIKKYPKKIPNIGIR